MSAAFGGGSGQSHTHFIVLSFSGDPETPALTVEGKGAWAGSGQVHCGLSQVRNVSEL